MANDANDTLFERRALALELAIRAHAIAGSLRDGRITETAQKFERFLSTGETTNG